MLCGMRQLSILSILFLGGILALSAQKIGDIEFYGYKGLDLAKIRAAMPVHEGEAFRDGDKKLIRLAVAGVIGKEPTDVSGVCCDKGKMLVYIGLPGASYRSFTYNPAPTGTERLPREILKLEDRFGHAMEQAVRKGGDATSEDDSQGYALLKDPAARAIQMKYRAWALEHEKEIYRVLDSSSSAADRRLAAELLGYVHESREQILALVHAGRDPDDDVRNNATRALGVLARSKIPLEIPIPPDTFIEMLNSGTWTDRNKGSLLLMELTESRDAALLTKLKEQTLDSLLEMAQWRESGHAGFARIIFGRVVGIPEERLLKLAWEGPVQEIIAAAKR
jgi:hypothetical protein